MDTHGSLALGLIGSIALAAAGCSIGEAGTNGADIDARPAPLPVVVTSPETVDLVATYGTTATISADADAIIPARVDGQVVEILVEEGDRVSEGQTLARLDGERLRLAMERVRAEFDKASREYARMRDLHERGLVSSATFDQLRYEMDALEAAYELRRLEYGYSAIRATIDGIVSAREVKVGTNVVAGQTAFRVTDTSRLVAYLDIPQSELSKFAVGHSAKLRVDAMPLTTFTATIALISPTIDAKTGTFRATAHIENTDGDLAPGMFGRFTIAYAEHRNALVIPAAAAVQEDSEIVVYVVRDGAAVRRVIEVGLRSNDRLEVLRGLAGDEKIVVTGQSSLRDGSPVLASIGTTNAVTG